MTQRRPWWPYAIVLVASLFVGGCAHGPRIPEQYQVSAAVALERWMGSEYEQAKPYLWWISDEVRKQLEALPVDKRDLPQRQLLGSSSRLLWIAECRCAFSFVLPILRHTHDERWQEVVADIEEYGLVGGDRTLAASRLGSSRNQRGLWERLRGDTRPTSFAPVEIAQGIFLAAEVRWDRDVDSVLDGRAVSMDLGGPFPPFGTIPPLLAPIYALAVGVDERVVHEKTLACMKLLREAELKSY